MTEYEKSQSGYLFDSNCEDEFADVWWRGTMGCYEFNNTRPDDFERQNEILHDMLGEIKGEFFIPQPFHCVFGSNITLGDHFLCNYNLTILDVAKVTIGDYVFIGPNVVISTSGHPLDAERRNRGLEIALPITIGNNVWIGANVTVLPGVTIGDDAVIGAGSVITKDIPPGVLAVGNPCRVLREITEDDKHKYPMAPE